MNFGTWFYCLVIFFCLIIDAYSCVHMDVLRYTHMFSVNAITGECLSMCYSIFIIFMDALYFSSRQSKIPLTSSLLLIISDEHLCAHVKNNLSKC